MDSWVLDEAKRRKKSKPRYGIYKGRRVRLEKITYGDVKRFKVYVVNPKTGLVKKINFGDRDMDLRKLDNVARASFLKKYHCDTAKNKATAEYWLCRLFKAKTVESLLKGESMLKKGVVLKESVGSDAATKIAEVWLFGGVADRIDDQDDEANVLSGKLRGYGRDVMDAVPSFMEDYDVSVEKYLNKLIPTAQEMVDKLNQQWDGKLTLAELEEEMGERVVTQFALGLLGHGVGMYDDMDVEKFMTEKGVEKPKFHAYEAEISVSMDAADELLQAVKAKDGDEMGESRKVVGFRKSLHESKDGYSFTDKDEQFDALVQFFNDNGQWQEEYFNNPDFAEAYDHMLKEAGHDESAMGEDFLEIWKQIPKEKKKAAWEWIIQNTKAEFNYWGSPGHRQDNSAMSFPHGGEEEVQLSGMYGHVNGKETNDVMAELTKGMDEEWIKKARQSSDYHVSDNDYLYVDASYSIIDFPVDLEEFKSFLKDEEGVVVESKRMVEADEDKKVTEHEIEDIGFDHSQYFRGRGVSNSEWEEVAVGVSSSAHEALEDALEQLASNGWDISGDLEKEVESLKNSHKDIISGVELFIDGQTDGDNFEIGPTSFEFAEIEAEEGSSFPAPSVEVDQDTKNMSMSYRIKAVSAEDAVEAFENELEERGAKVDEKALDGLRKEAQMANDNEMYYHVAIYVK